MNLNAGSKFGRWTVVRRVPGSKAECICVCGVSKTVYIKSLNNGRSSSCGCRRKEVSTKHGLTKSIEYSSWISMRVRCNNPRHCAYRYYGGKGIKVCKRWNNFENFLKDMGPRMSVDRTIERRNGHLGYTPSNCFWAGKITQMNNTSRNISVTAFSKTQTISQWAREVDLKVATLYYRIKTGMDLEEALTRKADWHIQRRN